MLKEAICISLVIASNVELAEANWGTPGLNAINGYATPTAANPSVSFSFGLSTISQTCQGTFATCGYNITNPGTSYNFFHFYNSSSGTAVSTGLLEFDTSGDMEWTGAGFGILDNGLQVKTLLSDCVLGSNSAGTFVATTLGSGFSCSSGTLSYSGTTTVNTSLNPPILSGSWQADDGTPSTKCTLSVGSQIADYPIQIKNTVLKINKFAVEVTNTPVSSVIDIGIRADNLGAPGTLVVDAGTITLASGANTSAAFTSTNLPQGRYWIEVETVAAGTTNAVVQGPTASTSGGTINLATLAATRLLPGTGGAGPVLLGTSANYMLISSATGTGTLTASPSGSFSVSNTGCMPTAAWLSNGGTL